MTYFHARDNFREESVTVLHDRDVVLNELSREKLRKPLMKLMMLQTHQYLVTMLRKRVLMNQKGLKLSKLQQIQTMKNRTLLRKH